MDGESANLRKRQDESSDSRLRRISMTVGLSSLRTLERETGFEPATSTLARLHSTTELLPHRKLLFTYARAICQRGEAPKFQMSVNREIGKKKHFPFVIVHLSFVIAQKSPNKYLALNWDRLRQ